jgi:hypothetical protein
MPLPQQNSVFIDPENCGSSLGYYITINEYKPKDKPTVFSMSSNVVLSDCNHKIDWGFDDAAEDKIDVVIEMLKEFKKKYVATKTMVQKLNR